MAGANVSDVAITCETNPPDTYTVGGTVSGLAGSGLVLQNNGGDDLAITGNGGFTFATALADGSAYTVLVKTHPSDPDQTCTVSNGSGSLSGTNVNDVSVTCVTLALFLINPGLNDAWYNPATAGQGFFIIVFADVDYMFLAWFTYDTERPPEDVMAHLGEPGHRWLTAQGPYDGDTATLDVYLTEGGVFDMAEPPAVTGKDPIGTITIVWSDCENGVLTYDIDPPGVSGEIPIKRIVPDNVALCEALAAE